MSDSEKKHPVLIVDDEPIVLRVLGELLTKAGYQPFTTTSAREAIGMVEHQQFSVIISDQQMNEMLGLDFLAAVRQIQPNASRILITGIRSLDVVVSAINKGEIFRFVAKPWVNAEMLATMGNAVQRYELLETNQRLHEETRKLNEELESANARLQQQVETLEFQKRELDESHRALQANFDRSVELCYRILNTFNPVLGEQTKRTVELCRMMTATEYFTEEERHVLIVSAWLHDIGLTGLPRSMTRSLQGGQAASPEIQQLIHDHPIYGQTLASFVDNLRSVGSTIRAHHERFDGKGYPDGLAGESIPWPARCLAVAVHYVASGKQHEGAAEEVLNLSGTAFDPEAVRLFLRCTQTGKPPEQIRQVLVNELRPGMQLARGIYSPTGILLIPEGQELDATTIHKLRNHSLLTSLPQQLLVYS